MKRPINTPSGWAWLIFAAINLLAACANEVPKLVVGLMLDPRWDLLLPAIGVLSALGLCQYAIGWRSPRSAAFWRIAAPLVVVAFTFMLARGYPATARVFALVSDSPLQLLGLAAMLALVFVPATLTAIAVLRLGDYLGPTRRPLGQKPAQLSLSFS